MNARVLVVAKAPIPGRVKTRLGNEIGMMAAAEVAAASLLDTITACRDGFGRGACHLALAGSLRDAVRRVELARAVDGWVVGRQRGETFAQRLANAHADVAGRGPVVQIGMDTPQLTAGLLHAAASGLDDHDAVLGPAEDGGWWVLGLRERRSARALRDVPMSTPTTYDDTRHALVSRGLGVAATTTLRDVDTRDDAEAVAALTGGTAFARAWAVAR